MSPSVSPDVLIADLVVNDAEPTVPQSDQTTLPSSSSAAAAQTRAAEGAASPASTETPPAKAGFLKRTCHWSINAARNLFELFCLISLLAVVTALPVLQLIAFGYLLDVAGKLTNGKSLADAVHGRRTAGKLGLAFVVMSVLGLPIQLLVHWANVADVIEVGTTRSMWLRLGAMLLAALFLFYLAWAWARGGQLKHYLWPQPKRFLASAWRPGTWLTAADSLIQMVQRLELPRLFWLGLRGAVGTLIWLFPAIVIIAANRHGTTGLAGLIGIIAFLALGLALLYLPMLQAHFASQNRLRAMFALRTIRQDFRRAPWAWLGAMIATLVILPIPLYLLKIEPPPPELMWLPTWFFIAFMLPARIACGCALRRSRAKVEAVAEPQRSEFQRSGPTGSWAFLSRWSVRLLMPAVVGVYLVFLSLSQYTSWDGLQTWIQQHAVLVPVPFVGV